MPGKPQCPPGLYRGRGGERGRGNCSAPVSQAVKESPRRTGIVLRRPVRRGKAAGGHRIRPAGMFAGLILALAGQKPIILGAGEDARTRQKKVQKFWETGELDPTANVQFGEGGAGPFLTEAEHRREQPPNSMGAGAVRGGRSQRGHPLRCQAPMWARTFC